MTDTSIRSEESAHSAKLFGSYAETGDPALREQLIVLHLDLVTRLAQRLAGRSALLDDLVQVGYVGLIKAIDRFEPQRGIQFATYAVPTIDGEMRRYLRDKANIIRIPRHLQELRGAASRIDDRLTQQLGRPPSVEEIAAALNVDPRRVEAVNGGQFAAPVSLERAGDGQDTSAEIIMGSADAHVEYFEERWQLMSAFEQLTARQRAILYLLFFEDLSQAQIGERLSISQMHVSRLARAALERLREGLERDTTD